MARPACRSEAYVPVRRICARAYPETRYTQGVVTQTQGVITQVVPTRTAEKKASRVRLSQYSMTSQQKVGVLTFHRCINYGSYWQARCLVEGLRARGLDAVILDHQSRRVNVAEWRCAFRPSLPTPTPTEDYPLYRAKMRKFFDLFDGLPLSPRFDLNDPATMEAYDTVVVGSDEVWNLCHPWYGGNQFFWGEGVRSQRLVSYAASFGNYDAWTPIDAFWAEKLKNFDAISVRDDNSRRIVQTALGYEPALVLDPCLQFPIGVEGDWAGRSEPYALVYGHNFSPWFSCEIQKWAQARGLKLLSIGYRNDWADEQWLTADPHDFAHIVAHASAVATNFFHGCVFSLINKRPFVCETTPYRSIKVGNLMATVGGESHLASETTPSAHYDAMLNVPLDERIPARIAELQRVSTAYLDEALV